MKGIHVNPKTRVARVQPGANWGEVDRETQLFNLAVPGGIVSTTGIAGLTVGGGFGWLSRKYGLTSDTLLSVDMVTAAGDFVTASATENPDLFWGIQGAGANLGIVTSFEYQLHPLDSQVVAGLIFYPIDQAKEVLEFYRDFAANAPNELTTAAILRKAPPAPFLAKEVHGTPVIGIAVCYAGPVEDGKAAIQPLKDFGSSLGDVIGPKPYIVHQSMLDAASPSGRQYYWKSEYLAELSDAFISTSIQHVKSISSPHSVLLLFQLGGAISQVGQTETAYTYRNAAFVANIASSWIDPAESQMHMDWTRNFWQSIQRFSTGGGYINFISQDEDEDRTKTAYGVNYERLVTLKNKYDPKNLFRTNQNIKPSS